jgi:DNA-binding NtrC family response regulator
VERACALTTGTLIEPSDIHIDRLPSRDPSGRAALLPEGKTLDQWEDDLIREAYRRANGNKSEAARMLGLSRNAMRYRLEKIGISDDSSKSPQE